VEVLRAALGDDLQLAADGAPVLRLVGVGQDLELGHGVDVRRRHVAAVIAVSMLATPSIVMLFEFGRWPFTVKLLT
jgi:hypothetical protein